MTGPGPRGTPSRRRSMAPPTSPGCIRGCARSGPVIRRGKSPDEDVAFLGGIDLCHGRGDDARHQGDPQAIELDPRYGTRPAWHDIQLEVRGPAVGDLDETFRERWSDPTPLDHRNPW